MPLPSGFVLEQSLSNLPEGFVLESNLPSNVPTKQGPFLGEERPAPVSKVEEKARTFLDYAKVIPELIATGVTSIPSAIAYGHVPSGSSPEAYQQAEERAAKYQFVPQSPVTQDILGTVGEAFNASKLPPFLPGLGQVGQATRQAITPLPSYVQAVTKTPIQKTAEFLRKEPVSTMAGVGAAEVPEAVTRAQMAQNLRVPITLRKGQLTRELGQQQFEAETAKTYPETVGKPLIKSQLDENEKILQNFDAYVDATGAERAGEYNLREVGRVVDKALVDSANKAKNQIDAAYTAAREAGETQQPVSYKPLLSYIESQTPTVKRKLAPILSAVEEEIKKNDPQGTGQVSINNLDDIYKFINQHLEPGTPAGNHGIEMKKIINAITEGQGGELYQKARALRAQYGKQFENVGYVDKLLRNKPGTSDRAVALEDVFDHSIMSGSLDDVRAIGQTLKKAGAEGEQAWKELQGQTIAHMKGLATKNITKDAAGNPIVSAARFNAFVEDLDKTGKLDYLFGKKGAQEIRDLRDTTILVNTQVPGINQSNTSSALIKALDKISGSPVGRIPGIKSIAEYGKSKALEKQVNEALGFDPMALAKGLKENK